MLTSQCFKSALLVNLENELMTCPPFVCAKYVQGYNLYSVFREAKTSRSSNGLLKVNHQYIIVIL